MAWEAWTVFVLTETVLCLVPGPAVLFVLAQGLGGGAPAALAAAMGILAANAFYFARSATGLGAVLLTSYELFSAIKWAGTTYLVWLGVRTFRAAPTLREVQAGAAGRLVGRGFLVQVANPKALVFFTALLPQFIDPEASVLPQVVILGVTSLLIELVVLAAYGMLAARATHLTARPGFLTASNRVAGGLLVAAGLRMAALRRAP
jgi:homoserine/homoserine lactone efflux protein